MTRSACRVSRLDLEAPTEAALATGVDRVLDAFEHAELPEAWSEQLVFVRHIDLGPLELRPEADLAATIAERLWSEIAPHLDGGAPSHNVVCFADRIDAFVALVRTVLAGRRDELWFARKVLSRWSASEPASAALRRVVRAVVGEEPSPLAGPGVPRADELARDLVELLVRLREVASLEPVLDALEPVEVRRWLGFFGEEDRSVGAVSSALRLGGPWTPVLRDLIARFGAEDERVLLAAVAAVVFRRPESLASRTARVHAARLARAVAEDVPVEAPSGEERTPAVSADRPTERPLPERGRDRADEVADPNGEPTRVGGLLFLLRVVESLELGPFLEQHPVLLECAWPARLLNSIARRVGAPADDPSLLPVDAVPFELEAFRNPSTWFDVPAGLFPSARGRVAVADGRALLLDESGRVPVAAWVGDGERAGESFPTRPCVGIERTVAPAADALLASWHLALGRWCRVHTGRSLRQVVLRPARVRSTRTHIDVGFDLRRADLDLRREGLDVDPGWVPWLGRVVSFHYLERDFEPEGRR